ncbi:MULTISPECIES: hypothetical protein [Flavobacterium]|uniref:Uncharacterized protein n=1 Tax=Flavobacterium jumunjinense TaxID=998845 RepID=A0ABV5GQR3_9FLAO|nr:MULTISPECIES: hypothetical protein [Flavobacterium]
MKTLKIKLLLLTMIAIASCQSLKTALFDHYSYQKTTAVKVETLLLMDKSAFAYETQKENIEKLLLEIDQLKEYEKNKPNNEITYEMWNVLTDKEKNLIGGYFKFWKEKQTLSPQFTAEAKKQISEALDLLIQYEVKKDRTSKDNLLEIITQ